jgi:hypothetical protein
VLDPSKLLAQGSSYVSAHVALTGMTVLAELSISTLFAVVFSDLRTTRAARRIHWSNPWYLTMERLRKPGRTVNLSVRLKTGTEVVGSYMGASTETDPSKRELVLHEPLYFRHANDAKSSKVEDWHFIIFAGSEIKYLSVQHVGEIKQPKAASWNYSVTAWLSKNWSK